MLNIFRSPKKQEIHKDETSLLVKQFNGLNIQVYGTYEEPLFKAKDIGDLLEMSNIREVIKNFNDRQRCDVSLTDAIGRVQNTTFLTEQGLYKVLMRSRKKIAEQFQDWVCEVVEEIRRKGKYDLEEQLKTKELEYQRQLQAKEQELLKYKEKTYEEIEKSGHLYVIKTDGGTKVGKTKDAVTKRVKGLQTGNVNNIEVLLDYHTSNADILEKVVHYVLDRYRCNSNREFFDCDIEHIKRVVRSAGSMMDTLKSCYQHITLEEFEMKLSSKIGVRFEDCACEDEEEVGETSTNNDFFNWLEENVEYNENSILKLDDVCFMFLGKKIGPRSKTKFKKEIERYIKTKYHNVNNVYQDSKMNDTKYKGWLHFCIKLVP